MKGSLLAVIAIAALFIAQGCGYGERQSVSESTAVVEVLTTPSPRPAVPTALPTPRTGWKKGNFALNFQLKDLQGNIVSLRDFRGKVVLLNFWASWCPACKEEMPSIEHIFNDYKDRGFEVLAIDIMEDEKTVKDFIEKNNLSFAVLMDYNGEVYNNYRIVAIPTTFVIDSEGIIRQVIIGAVVWDSYNYRMLIESLLLAK